MNKIEYKNKNTITNEIYCLNCGKELIKTQRKYCCNSCQVEYQYKEYINYWKSGLESGIRGEYQLSLHIEKYIKEKYNNKCCKCGWCEINFATGKIPLEIHHKDGDYTNNKEENLELLCPNCHALTDTYKNALNHNGRSGRKKYYKPKKEIKNYCCDCGVEIKVNSKRCRKCENIYRVKISFEKLPVSKEELSDLICHYPFTQIGKMYNVSDNAVRKWCKKYELPYLHNDIKKYKSKYASVA